MTKSSLVKILSGEWSGAGTGEYPTIEPFEYQESLRFTPDETRPLIHYEQKTRRRNSEQAEFIPPIGRPVLSNCCRTTGLRSPMPRAVGA